MALNYTFTSEIFTVDSNSQWVELDLDGDGISEGGLRPIIVYLEPNSGYTIDLNDFTIAGESEVQGGNWNNQNFLTFAIEGWNEDDMAVSFTPTAREWDSADNSLPEGVEKVIGYNRFEPHTVENKIVFLVFIKPDYQVMYDDIQIMLDFDGDAQPINSDNNNPGLSGGQDGMNDEFHITLSINDPQWLSVGELPQQPEPNYFIVPNTKDHVNNLENYWNISIPELVLGSSLEAQTAGRAASLRFKKHYAPDGTALTYSDSSIAPSGSGASNLSILFYLIPKPGYSLSRHMLQPYMMYSPNPAGSATWNDNQYYPSTNRNIHQDISTSNMLTPMQGLLSNGLELIDITNLMELYGMDNDLINSVANELGPGGIPGFGKDQNGSSIDDMYPYYANIYDNVQAMQFAGVSLAGPGGQGSAEQSSYFLSSLFPSTNNSNWSLGISGDIFLIDIKYNANFNNFVYPNDIWPGVEPGYNFGLTGDSWVGNSRISHSSIPDGYCPQDYEGNAVAVMVNNFNQFIPPSEILQQTASGGIRRISLFIGGHAIQNEANCESVGYNIQIEEG